MTHQVMEVEKTIRTHRVGAITAGCSMIIFGVLFLLHVALDLISYRTIFSLWPLMLVGLGTELLAASMGNKSMVYDKAAVVLLFLVTLFAMGMAGADLCFAYMADHWMYF